MRKVTCLFALLVACSVIGCGSARSKVEGKIVKGGQPFTVSEKGVFVLSFVPESGAAKETYNATTKHDGTFVIVGPEGRGVPPGKYKVHLKAMDPYPTKDLLNNKFGDPNTTPLSVDIGSSTLVVDVGK